MPVPSTNGGITSCAAGPQSVPVASSCGEVVGTTRSTNASDAAGSSWSLGNGGDTERDTRILRDDVRDLLHGGGIRWVVDLDRQQERAVVARAEAFGDQVVRLTGGGVLGEIALVGESQPQTRARAQ